MEREKSLWYICREAAWSASQSMEERDETDERGGGRGEAVRRDSDRLSTDGGVAGRGFQGSSRWRGAETSKPQNSCESLGLPEPPLVLSCRAQAWKRVLHLNRSQPKSAGLPGQRLLWVFRTR